MDKFEQLVREAQSAVVIMENQSGFELIDLDREPLSEARSRELDEGGFVFVGVIAIVNGVPRTALAVPLDPVAISALSQAFVKGIEDALIVTASKMGDSAEWLARLYRLPDMRAN